MKKYLIIGFVGLLISLLILAGCKSVGEAVKGPTVKKEVVCAKCADFAKKVDINCYDSDNGINYEVYGFTFGELPAQGGPQGFQTDQCVEYSEEGYTIIPMEGQIANCSGDKCGVIEFSCKKGGISGFYVSVSDQKCPNGCSQGRCI